MSTPQHRINLSNPLQPLFPSSTTTQLTLVYPASQILSVVRLIAKKDKKEAYRRITVENPHRRHHLKPSRF
jgi:hypothetical protein